MKRLILAFAPLTLIACAPALLAEQKDTERVTRSIAIDPGGTLRLKSFSGRVDISAYDGREVMIEAVRRAPRERLDHIRLDVHGGGSTVYVDANKRDSSWSWDRHNNVVE